MGNASSRKVRQGDQTLNNKESFFGGLFLVRNFSGRRSMKELLSRIQDLHERTSRTWGLL